MAKARVPLQDRLWEKVDVAGENECWEWTAYKSRDGYGQIFRDGQNVGAHRVSWEIHNGPIPDGLCALHKCDNRGCVNPAHLFLGTQADNVADMVAKERQASEPQPGERNGQSKLTKDQVIEIRRRYTKGDVYQRQLGKEYGVGRSQITRIISGEKWPHVQEGLSDAPGG